ncbi:hypothetical protein FH972_024031 [Carpinus fangiana]|uniref:Protein kinase domain-containing protein n=1 Tax=Carpinus fangiana TaxID=176857 RepID=A0A5N6KXJ4_9ROSI|nr:hypothetical protein FH972_024031 [Carpinus fangiana]
MAGTPLDVLQANELFHDDGSIETLVLCRDNGQLALARSKHRYFGHDKVLPAHLYTKTVISQECYRPLTPSTFTEAKPEAQGISYIKTPDLICFDVSKPDTISNLILGELKVCEKIRLSPHVNVAEYFGCQVQDGRITGLCFTKYRESLATRVNPGHLNKEAFKIPGAFIGRTDVWIKGIQAGLKHLHSLGFVHNDISPSNIMFGSDDDSPIIIDFDSCCRIGEDKGEKKGTPGWYDPAVTRSMPENDFLALEEMALWLSSADTKTYQFPL